MLTSSVWSTPWRRRRLRRGTRHIAHLGVELRGKWDVVVAHSYFTGLDISLDSPSFVLFSNQNTFDFRNGLNVNVAIAHFGVLARSHRRRVVTTHHVPLCCNSSAAM